MKRLISILALVFIIIGTASAQTATFYIPTRHTIDVVNTDYTITNTTAVWFLWNAERDMRATQDYQVNLDSLTGDHTNIDISLYGRKFSDDSWTQIGSTTSSTDGTATETISNTAANRYRQYKVLFTPTGTGTTIIDFQKFKIWNE
jgi:hypothetical protein